MKGRNPYSYDEYVWVIGGGAFHALLVKEAKAMGYGVILSDRNIDCVAANHADIFLAIAIHDIKGHIEEALRLRAGHCIKVAAVIAIEAGHGVITAVLARTLGVAGIDPVAAHIASNRSLFRTHMEARGFLTPRASMITGMITGADLKDIESAMRHVGFPLVVKNGDSGMRGASIFRDKPEREDMAIAVNKAISASRSGRALIEELWMGTAHSVEAIFDCKGRFHPLSISERRFTRVTELMRPERMSLQMQNKAYALVHHAAESIGIGIGPVNADIVATDDGLRVVEFAAMPSGAGGLNRGNGAWSEVLKAVLLTHLGKTFDLSLKECS